MLMPPSRMKELRIYLSRVDEPAPESVKIDSKTVTIRPKITKLNLMNRVRSQLLTTRNTTMLPKMKELRIRLKRVDETKLNIAKLDIDKNDSKIVPMRSTRTEKNIKQTSKNETNVHQCVTCKKTYKNKKSLHSHIRCHRRENLNKCKTCGKAYDAPSKLKAHEATHEINRPRSFTCEHCSKSFYTKAHLNLHVRRHGKKEFKCPICPKLFLDQDKGSFRLHLRTHTKEKPYSCSKCDYRCKSQSSMTVHERMPHTNQCSHCSFKFVNNRRLQIHKQQHGGPSLYTCPTCEVTLLTKRSLTRHSRKHTTDFRCDICLRCSANSSRLAEHKLRHFKGKEFLCKLCYKEFKTADELQVHMKNRHADAATFKCSGCTKTFSNETTANEHVIQASANDSQVHAISVSYKQLTFKCKYCKVTFSVESDLVKHMEIHAKPEQYNCEFCQKSFPKSWRLQTHLRMHTGEKPFRCDIKNCGRQFIQAGNLKRHQETHSTDRKLHPCTLCDSNQLYRPQSLKNHITQKHTTRKLESCKYEGCTRTFHYKSQLNGHVKIVHLGEKPHKCEFCEKTFSVKHNLQSHLSTHTRERIKLHACEYCKKLFNKKSEVREHVRRVHYKERTHLCMFCNMSFFIKQALNVHMKTHTKEKSVICEICDKCYGHKSSLLYHMKVQHSNKAIT